MGEDFLDYINVREETRKRDKKDEGEREPYWGWALLDNKGGVNEVKESVGRSRRSRSTNRDAASERPSPDDDNKDVA